MTHPPLQKLGPKTKPMARGAVVVGARKVKRGCIDESKKLAYQHAFGKKFKDVIPLDYFMVDHDFEKDSKYLMLSRPLNFPEIELAKRISLGEKAVDALRTMYKDVQYRYITSRSIAFRKRMPALQPLIDYFRDLQGTNRRQGVFSVREAFESMKEDIRACPAGKERYALTEKFISLCGLDKQMREFAREEIGDGGASVVGTAPNLAATMAMAGLSDGPTP